MSIAIGYRVIRKLTIVSLGCLLVFSALLFLDFDFDSALSQSEHENVFDKAAGDTQPLVSKSLELTSDPKNNSAVNQVSTPVQNKMSPKVDAHVDSPAKLVTSTKHKSDQTNKGLDDQGYAMSEKVWELNKKRAKAGGVQLSRLKPILGERWFGGVVQKGIEMPYGASSWRLDLADTLYNQVNPVLVSTKGRYIWSETPYTTVYSQGVNGSGALIIESRGEVVIGDVDPSSNVTLSLRDAYLKASAAHFPPSGVIPEELLFTAPQYNLWIQCLYDPTQEKVLEYAEKAIQNGFPPGVIMIDTNWAEYYGSLDFHPARFPNPRAMCEKLHQMGFKVMVWVVPFVSPDSNVFREARQKGYLLRNVNNMTAISEWWDGYSALVDFSHPPATAWFHRRLQALVDIGVDGFKFDGGDPEYYKYHGEATGSGGLNAHGHCEAFGRVGLEYTLSEYRAAWKLAGTRLVQRLSDKSHRWDHKGLGSILPNGLVQSLSGYGFNCPDMIGGGQYSDFVEVGTLEPKEGFELDQELFVRYAQASALFPMMQFSLAPWAVLGPENLRLCLSAAKLHARLAPKILQLANHHALTGEPIIRHMAYQFPNTGLDDVVQQFMLGSDTLVAPVLEKGVRMITVHIPPGRWQGQDGASEWEFADGSGSSEDSTYIQGPRTVTIATLPYGRMCELPWFTLIGE